MLTKKIIITLGEWFIGMKHASIKSAIYRFVMGTSFLFDNDFQLQLKYTPEFRPCQ